MNKRLIIILFFIITSLVGGMGYYNWSRNQSDNNISFPSSTPGSSSFNTSPSPSAELFITAGEYKNVRVEFSPSLSIDQKLELPAYSVSWSSRGSDYKGLVAQLGFSTQPTVLQGSPAQILYWKSGAGTLSLSESHAPTISFSTSSAVLTKNTPSDSASRLTLLSQRLQVAMKNTKIFTPHITLQQVVNVDKKGSVVGEPQLNALSLGGVYMINNIPAYFLPNSSFDFFATVDSVGFPYTYTVVLPPDIVKPVSLKANVSFAQAQQLIIQGKASAFVDGASSENNEIYPPEVTKVTITKTLYSYFYDKKQSSLLPSYVFEGGAVIGNEKIQNKFIFVVPVVTY